jgi:hypothetical protein
LQYFAVEITSSWVNLSTDLNLTTAFVIHFSLWIIYFFYRCVYRIVCHAFIFLGINSIFHVLSKQEQSLFISALFVYILMNISFYTQYNLYTTCWQYSTYSSICIRSYIFYTLVFVFSVSYFNCAFFLIDKYTSIIIAFTLTFFILFHKTI